MELNEEIFQLYERWLMDNYADEIHCKDQLIQASENLVHYDVFVEEVAKALVEGF